MDSNIDFGNITLRAQKKFSSLFSNRKTITPIIDEDSKQLIKCLYHAFKEIIGKKEADKLTTRLIKILIKVAILAKNDQFNEEELSTLQQVHNTFHNFIKIVLSFWTIDYTYEYPVLKNNLHSIEKLLQKVLSRHMTEKNKTKLEDIFEVLSQESFLELFFRNDYKELKFRDAINDLVAVLEAMISNNKL